MIDTRMKVDGKWNFNMDNVIYILLMLLGYSYIFMDVYAGYENYQAEGTFVISAMSFFVCLWMMVITQRRHIDRLYAMIKSLENRG
ncbi:hypothetical protein Aeh1ORF140c [Aeromonas phage Aeh1]|uniref:Uncharacterized protein n=1 Tax=Aeromonas phage Aeh1 TaxID=2880362 RepID=Q76YU1_9CAUD|nr:hypothetical protein Aeh1p150 [Aeromonas phage Aeh1]AAQ17805.1 hypothetical protein Aeh1ORF140c [Aeromonas phage Aeh1]